MLSQGTTKFKSLISRLIKKPLNREHPSEEAVVSCFDSIVKPDYTDEFGTEIYVRGEYGIGILGKNYNLTMAVSVFQLCGGFADELELKFPDPTRFYKMILCDYRTKNPMNISDLNIGGWIKKYKHIKGTPIKKRGLTIVISREVWARVLSIIQAKIVNPKTAFRFKYLYTKDKKAEIPLDTVKSAVRSAYKEIEEYNCKIQKKS